jgi:hypothetical protein
MQKAKLYKRPNAQFVCEDTLDVVINAFNEADPFERDLHFIVLDHRIFHADEIDKLQGEMKS